MTFLDNLGQMAQDLGNFTGLNDAWHDFGIAIGDVQSGQYVNAAGSAFVALPHATSTLMTNATTAADQKIPGHPVTNYNHMLAGIQAVGSLIASQSFEPNVPWNTRFDQTIGAVQRNPQNLNNNMAGVTINQQIYNAGYNNAARITDQQGTNDPFLMTNDQKQQQFGQGIGMWATGTGDLLFDTIADPLNFAGGASAGLKLAVKGPQVTERISRLAAFGGMQMTPESFGSKIAQAVNEHGATTNHIGETFQKFAQNNSDWAAEHPWVKDQPLSEQKPISMMLGGAKTPQEVQDVFHVLGGTPQKDGALNNLLSINEARGGLEGTDMQVLLHGVSTGEVPTSVEAQSFAAHLSDPNGSMNRAWTQSLERAHARPDGIIKTALPQNPLVAKLQNAIADRGANSLDRPVSFRDAPNVSSSQPTRFHPIMSVVDFFGKERGSGWINFNDEETTEVRSLIQDVNRETGNAFLNPVEGGIREDGVRPRAEGDVWHEMYLNAKTNTDKSKIVKMIEARGLYLIVQRHSKNLDMTPEQIDQFVEHMTQQLNSRRDKALADYRETGMVADTVMNKSSLTKLALLERENVDALPLADMKQFATAIKRHENVLRNFTGTWLHDAPAEVADVFNDIWKTSVLLRLGYPQRNLAEAGLSIAASGNFQNVVMGALAEHNLAGWAGSKWDALVDGVKVRAGVAPDLRATERQVRLAAAQRSMAEQNLAFVRRGVLKNANYHLSPEEQDLLERFQTEQKFLADGVYVSSRYEGLTTEELAQAKALQERLVNVSKLRSESSRMVTYHRGTSDFAKVEGDFVDTTPSWSLAQLRKDDAYESVNFATVNRRPIAFADQQPTTTVTTLNEHQPYPPNFQLAPDGSLVAVPETTSYSYANPIPAQLRNGYQNILDTAIDHVRNGQVVEQLSGSTWRTMSEAQLQVLKERPMVRSDAKREFRVRDAGPAPATVSIPSYGDDLDLRSWARVPDELKPVLNIHSSQPRETPTRRTNKPSFAEWKAAKSWNDPQTAQALNDYARANGFGRILLPDAEWGHTVRVLKENVDGYGGKGAKAVLNAKIRQVQSEAATKAELNAVNVVETSAATDRRANRAMRADARKRGVSAESWDVQPGFTQAQLHEMANGSTLDGIRLAVDNHAEAIAAHEAALTTHGIARAARDETLASRGGFGKRGITVQTEDGPRNIAAFNGSQGELMQNRIHGDQAWLNRMVGNGANVHRTLPGYEKINLSATDPRYYDAWANVLNFHWRDPRREGIEGIDPLARQVYEGRDPNEVEAWLKGPGRAYADEKGWNDSEIPTVVGVMFQVVQKYLPEKVRPLWEQGTVTAEQLRHAYPNTKELPDLTGMDIPTSNEFKQAANIRTAVEGGTRWMMHKLGSAPETLLARNPLFNGVFRKNFSSWFKEAEARKGAPLTETEVNAIAASARETARITVGKTLFTLTSRTGAGETFRYVSPFYSAWENVLKRWSRFAVTNPDSVFHLATKQQQFHNNSFMVDMTTGDPVTDLSKVDPKNVAMVWPWKVADHGINVPLSSLDTIFQGQGLNPGVGPFVAMPLAKIVANAPSAEKLMNWAFPVGYPREVADVWLPSAAKHLKDMFSQNQTFHNDMMAIEEHEVAQYRAGKRKDMPTIDELTSKTNDFEKLKVVANMTSPVSFRYTDDVTYYKDMYRKYQAMYGKEADARFLQDHPEYFDVTQSLSKNSGGVWATQATVDNLQKYGQVASLAAASGDDKLVGWVGNYGQNTYDPNSFSPASYNWELANSPAPGSANYRQPRNPQELQKDTNVSEGWVKFNNLMDSVESQLKNMNVDTSNPAIHKALMSVVVGSMRQDKSNADWMIDFNSTDRARFEKRADFFTQALQDPTFMADHKNDTQVVAMQSFLNMRVQVANQLQNSLSSGGSYKLTAKSNSLVQQYYLQQVQSLKDQSLGFANWYDKYFANDTVVL